MVRRHHVAEWPLLRQVRQREHLRGSERQADAILVPGLPVILQRQDRDGHCQLQHPPAEMGYRHLPVPDITEKRLQHEAAPGHRRVATHCLVHAAPDTGSLGAGIRMAGSAGRSRWMKPTSAASVPTCRSLSRATLQGRGTAGKSAVAGIKDRESNQVRAKMIRNADTETLQGFIVQHTEFDAKVYTDNASPYAGMPFDHESVNHSVGEYVKGQAHTNGIESFWSMLKRAHKGTFSQDFPKAPGPVHPGVRRQTQPAGIRYACADAGDGLRPYRPEPSLQEPCCRQRPC